MGLYSYLTLHKFAYHDTIVMDSWYHDIRSLGIDALHDMADNG